MTLPLYPLLRGQTAQNFVAHWFNHRRLLRGNIVRRLGFAAYGAWHQLLCHAFESDPCGALPDDDGQLAWMLHVEIDVWRGLRADGALYGWEKCLVVGVGEDPSQGVASLMHPMVTAEAERMIGVQAEHEQRRYAKAEATRLARLRDKCIEAGVPRLRLENESLLRELDADLEGRGVKRRTLPLIRALCEEVGLLEPPAGVRVVTA